MTWPPADTDLPTDITSFTDADTGASVRGGSPARPTYVHATVENAQNQALRDAGDTLLPAADGFTVATAANPVTGSGTINVASFPADAAVMAVKRDGDAFPRFLLVTEGNTTSFYFGDGTFDPYANGNSFAVSPIFIAYDGFEQIVASDALMSVGSLTTALGDIEAANPAAGLIIQSPDTTRHRIKVANDGTLSTEVVT